MEDFNDLGLMYYRAVDSKNDIFAAELLAKIITNVKEDNRILNLLSKFKISDLDKEDFLALINEEIWSNPLSRSRTKRWNAEKMTFDNWILANIITIIRKHENARKRSISTKVMLETERPLKLRGSELKRRGNLEVNRSDLSTIEVNQTYLDKLLSGFLFRFPQPFFLTKDNNSIQVSGIPILSEDSEKTDYCICVNNPETMLFKTIRKFKAIIIALQPSGNTKTLKINGSETIDASEIETNSLCSLAIILEKLKVSTDAENAEAFAVVDDWNSIDTSKLSDSEIGEALKIIFGKIQKAKLPILDAPRDLTLNHQPEKNQSPIYEFSFPLAMSAAGKDDSDWVYGKSESFDGCYGKVQASIDTFQPNNSSWLRITTSVEFPQEMVAIFLGEEIKVPGFFVGLENVGLQNRGRICLNHLLVLKLVDNEFLANPKFQLRPFNVTEMGSSIVKDKMYASFKAVTQHSHPAFERYLGLTNDAR